MSTLCDLDVLTLLSPLGMDFLADMSTVLVFSCAELPALCGVYTAVTTTDKSKSLVFVQSTEAFGALQTFVDNLKKKHGLYSTQWRAVITASERTEGKSAEKFGHVRISVVGEKKREIVHLFEASNGSTHWTALHPAIGDCTPKVWCIPYGIWKDELFPEQMRDAIKAMAADCNPFVSTQCERIDAIRECVGRTLPTDVFNELVSFAFCKHKSLARAWHCVATSDSDRVLPLSRFPEDLIEMELHCDNEDCDLRRIEYKEFRRLPVNAQISMATRIVYNYGEDTCIDVRRAYRRHFADGDCRVVSAVKVFADCWLKEVKCTLPIETSMVLAPIHHCGVVPVFTCKVESTVASPSGQLSMGAPVLSPVIGWVPLESAQLERVKISRDALGTELFHKAESDRLVCAYFVEDISACVIQ